MSSGYGRCKYCGRPVRWVDHAGHRLALEPAPVDEGGTFAVIGAESAIRIRKAQRAQYGRLYEEHNTRKNCPQWERAQAMKAREAAARKARSEPPPNLILFDKNRGQR